MLCARMNITFFEVNSEFKDKKSYIVSCCTYRFNSDIYLTGFFKALDGTNEYFFENNYLVDVVFPAVDDDYFAQNKNKIIENPKIDIVMGSKAVGKAELLSWEFKSINPDEFKWEN